MSTAPQPNSTYSKAGSPRGLPMAPPSLRAPLVPVAADRSAPYGHAIAIIRKLEICLDEETAVLSAPGVPDLDSFNHRKGQGLMELNRALAGFGTTQRDGVVEIELARLKRRIDENMRLLRLHISAVNEITGLLTDAIQKEESDGTYSPAIRAQWK